MNANSSTTTSKWLVESSTLLSKAGIATSRLDCLVLLEDCLSKDRAHLLAHPEEKLNTEQISTLRSQIIRREKHEPLAYIRGKTEFYGRDFAITHAVLEPRPETETMIDLLKQLEPVARKTVIDVGTGSGAIGITAAIELGEVQVLATDIDPNCLKIARQNCIKHKATVALIETDLLKGVSAPKGATILSNLPYVPNDFVINQAALHEPRIAIFGGPDGLDLYRKLFRQIKESGVKPTYILTESLPTQHKKLAAVANESGFGLAKSVDFIQLFSCKS